MTVMRLSAFSWRRPWLAVISVTLLLISGGCERRSETPEDLAKEFLVSWLEEQSRGNTTAKIQWRATPPAREGEVPCVDGNVFYPGWKHFLPLKTWEIEGSEATKNGFIFSVRIPDPKNTRVPFAFEVNVVNGTYRMGKVSCWKHWVEAI